MTIHKSLLPVLVAFGSGLALAQTGVISAYVGNGTRGFSGDGGAALSAMLSSPFGLALDANGNLFIADVMNFRIRKVSGGLISTVAGGGAGGDGVAATTTQLQGACFVKADVIGNIYLTENCVVSASGGSSGGGIQSGTYSGLSRIRKIDASTAIISTIAGGAISGFAGDGGPASAALLSMPSGMAFDASGNLFFADTGSNHVRRIDSVTGIVTTIAGTGIGGFAGDGGPATAAALNGPASVAVDASGNVYIADTSNFRIRRVDATTGIITTAAGNGTSSFNGDGIPAISAGFGTTIDLLIDSSGNVVFSDATNNRVRVVDHSTGLIWTIAGGGTNSYGCCYSQPATVATLSGPSGLALAPDGTLLISERSSNRVRQVSFTNPLAITAVSLTPSATSLPAGFPLTLTASLTAMTGVAANATGTVELQEGNTGVGSGTIVNGSVTVTTSTLTLGTHTIQAAYLGDSVFAPSIGLPVTITITQPQSAVALTANPTVEAYGQPVTLTATVTPSVATGSVTFMNGSTALGSAPVINGVASQSVVLPMTGNYNIVAQYSGDSAFPGSSSAQIGVNVLNATAVTLASNGNPVTAGASVTFTASVNTAATGTVQFFDGGTALGATRVSSGGAMLTTSTLSVGTHLISASYSGDNNYAPVQSAVLSERVAAASTTVALASNANPSVLGTPVTFTASVSPSMATGTVQFSDGATVLGTGTLANAVATFSTSALASGTHTIVASYSGDSNYSSSNSATVSQAVKTTTTISLTSDANPAIQGVSVTFTATVSPSTASGTVQFSDGGVVIGTGSITNGSASFTMASLAVGTHSIAATYSGDSNDSPSASGAVTQVIKGSTAVTLVSSANPANVGSSVTFTATVTPATASGTIQFSDGSAVIGTGAVTNGAASVATTSLAPGTHNVVAAYSGDSNNVASTSGILSQGIKATTSVGLVSSANPVSTATSVTFTAAVTPPSATGTVQFSDGGAVVGSGTLVAGSASFSTASLTAGTHNIVAVYSGDLNDTASSSSALSQVVKGATTIALVASANPTLAGNSVTFTATVTPTTATGMVQFLDGATVLGTVSVANGATLTTSALTQGSHSITAIYSGDSNNASSTSSVLTEAVKTLSGLNPVATPNPAMAGQVVTLSATVNSAATGIVTFTDGSTVLANVTVAAGLASYSTSMLAPGPHAIGISYSGDTNYMSSGSSFIVTILTNATVALSSSVNPSVSGQSLTLTARVAPATASGTVQFTDGATTLGTASLVGGVAQIATTLDSGVHSLTAYYSGDAANGHSTSAVLAQTVKANAAVLLASNVNPAVIGQMVVFTAGITPSTATGSVQFLDGNTLIGTVTVTSGGATLSTSQLAQGTHSITAVYSGDGNDTGATSAAIPQTINLAAPAAPSSLTASAAGMSQINLAWVASATGGVTYNVYASTSNGFVPSAANRIASGVTVVNDVAAGLSPGTNYYFRVTAVKAGAESTATAQASATTTPALSCHVSYSLTSQWATGFNSSISIQNTGTTAISLWSLTWTWAGNQTVTNSWNASYLENGANVTLTHMGYNGTIAAGATASGVGFSASYTGTNTAPSAFYVNGTLCH